MCNRNGLLVVISTLILAATSIPAQAALIVYADRPSFGAAHPWLIWEGFEAGTIHVGFSSPLDSTSDNSAFSPGEIRPGIAYWNLSDDTLSLVDGNDYPGMTSKTLLKSSESLGGSSLHMTFSLADNRSVGFDIYHTTGGSTGLIAAETTISVYGVSGLLGAFPVTTSDSGPVFFGVHSQFEPITSINVDGVVPGFYSFEGIDDVVFNGDSDQDGWVDNLDNCIVFPNDDQRDTDNDGHGNPCDPDFDNNCDINFADLVIMSAGFFGSDPNLDLDGNGTVNFGDLELMIVLFFDKPGPSGAGICPP